MAYVRFFTLIGFCLFCHCQPSREVKLYTTTADRQWLLAEQELTPSRPSDDTIVWEIKLDTAVRYQSIDGFGFTLTGGSARLIYQLDSAARAALLRELFTREGNGIGIRYLRVSMGASDLDDQVFSYCDLPAGEVDPQLDHFNLSRDTLYLIPLLKEIRALSPDVNLMASPWSAPAWMKASFVKNNLGPAFQKNRITTRIVVYDHNCDHPEYPISILNDSVARKFVDGSAFHLYAGEASAMANVHAAHPDKNIYFTEQWTSAKGEFGGDLQWHARHVLIGTTQNWARTVLEWNLANDPEFGPHTDDGGCTSCLGALTIGDSITRNVSYYIIAHASRFVPPGSVRVYSNGPDSLPHVAFRTPEGKVVVIVQTDRSSAAQVRLLVKRAVGLTLPAHSLSTVVMEN